jgi:hypothetical protein
MQQLILKKNISQSKMKALIYFLNSWDIEVEVKTNTEVSNKKKPSDFFGTMSEEVGEKMQTYITQSRNEWDRNI